MIEQSEQQPFKQKIHYPIVDPSLQSQKNEEDRTEIFTQCKEVPDQLHQSEEKFSHFFHGHSAMMLQIDPVDGRILELNNAARQFYGIDQHDERILFISDLNTLSNNEIMAEMRLAIEQKRNYFNFKHKTRSGEIKDVEVHSTPIQLIDKTILFSIIHDTTQRKKTENDLVERTRELENFFNISLELLCIASNEGYFVKMSREWENVLGYTIEELTSRPLLEFIHPDDVQPTKEMLSDLTEQQPIHFFINRYRTKKGSYRYLEWNSMPAGNRIYAAARDITDRVHLQKSLEQSIQKEKELNDLKSRFVSMASHEFRTPLTSILMSTETLRSYWSRMNAQQIDSKLANIHTQISHLTNIVTNVLQLARIQEGKLLPDMKPVEIVAVCRSVISSFLSNETLQQSIRFSTQVESLVITADEVMIRQVFINLISNAIKYSQPNPQIDIQLFTSSNQVELMVSDNGIGIPEIDKKRVFQPFFRASNAKGIEGNGLGLNIIKETIHLHGGHVRFVSTPLKGTTFYVELPIMQPMNNSEQ